MDEKKQIEEIAGILLRMDNCETHPEIECIHDCRECHATQLYNAGFRKQSEVHPLPCKIGDKIYEVTGEPGEQIDIDEYIISEVGLNGVFTNGRFLRHRHYFAYEDEGASWFFRKEDAENEKKRRDDP